MKKRLHMVIAVILLISVVASVMAGTDGVSADAGTQAVSEVKVLIRTSNYASSYHSSIVVSSGKPFTLSNGTKTRSYKAGKKVTIKSSNSLLKNGSSIYVKAKNNGKIKIASIIRGYGTPAYRGYMEIKNVAGRGLALINHVSMEAYLYGVVGSEMSASFSEEALKAQAVIARSYAYACLSGTTYASIGADFDDSTSYQVYNNTKESALIRSAVDSTKGQVLKTGGKVFKTYFFSTSCGKTGLPSDMWGGTEGDASFNSAVQTYETVQEDLSTNEKFEHFLEEYEDAGIESKVDWYRWSASISNVNMTKQINRKLTSCYLTYPSYVKVVGKDGSLKGQLVGTVGNVTDIQVIERKKSGMVSVVQITGTSATIQVSNVTAIRMLLAPYFDRLTKKNGSVVTGLTYLPSGFFNITKNSKGGYNITGGGYGHGIGLSQNGANQMAQNGYEYKKILEHYYRNITIDVY